MRASISSKKITAGCFDLATSNSACEQEKEFDATMSMLIHSSHSKWSSSATFMSFSPSPRYLLVTDDDVIEKNANPDSVATAFASSVFPVPDTHHTIR